MARNEVLSFNHDDDGSRRQAQNICATRLRHIVRTIGAQSGEACVSVTSLHNVTQENRP